MPERSDRDHGFTLIELLVVMIIIGILASIAIPIFISQRQKAFDAATKSDVSRLGKEVTAYYVDGTAALTLNGTASTVQLLDGATLVSEIPISQGTVLATYSGLVDSTSWCVSLKNPKGAKQSFRYSAAQGLTSGIC